MKKSYPALLCSCALVTWSAPYFSACGNDDASGGAQSDGGDGGAAGAPNEGPPDTLFQDDVVNEIEEGNYFLTGEGNGRVEVTLALSFRVAMHVELRIAGGTVDDVQGSSSSDTESRLQFEFPTNDSATCDLSAGRYSVTFSAREVDGEFRIDLDAAPLGGSEL